MREETLIEIIRRQMVVHGGQKSVGPAVFAITFDEFAELKRAPDVRGWVRAADASLGGQLARDSILIDDLWRFVPHLEGMSIREVWGVELVPDENFNRAVKVYRERRRFESDNNQS